MKIDAWCREHGITKANYYYCLRRVREAYLELCDPVPSFVELTAPVESIPAKVSHTHSSVAAAFHTKNGIAIDIYNDASLEFLRNLILGSQQQNISKITIIIKCAAIKILIS